MPPPNSLLDALNAQNGHAALRELDDARNLTRFVPELEQGRGFKQPELHYYDVLDHNLAAVAALDAALSAGEDGRELRAGVAWIDFDSSLDRRIEGVEIVALIRLACLLHDVAKPATAI